MRRPLLLLLALLALLCGPAGMARAEGLDLPQAVAAVQAEGDALVAAYQPQQRLVTMRGFSALYFQRFDGPLENAIGAADPGLKTELEGGFAQLIGLARQGVPPETLAAAWNGVRGQLDLVPARLDRGGFWSTLLQSMLILVREGVEALLVVSALLAVLTRTGAGQHARVIYQGVAWAVVASLGLAWVISEAVALSGAAREAIEGGTMLVAAAVLFYCTWWLLAKREAARWQAYVQAQIGAAAAGRRLFALGFAAFLAVFREGAETVLFYQALLASAPGQEAALSLGIAVAVIALAAIYLAMRFLTVRLPLKLFFSATAALLYYLAVSFAGNGVVEMQTARVLPATVLPGWPTLSWLGIHPTLEGMAAQGLLVLPTVAVGVWWLWRRDRAGRPRVAS
ncbi:FTR1 family iron permease [Phaeospirillum tilakii]|uniref:FTR1 family protein n=1 Tax=Phaeospirillum tilakii TaxID=741673 RepID=A0ABW5CDN7_9PROT